MTLNQKPLSEYAIQIIPSLLSTTKQFSYKQLYIYKLNIADLKNCVWHTMSHQKSSNSNSDNKRGERTQYNCQILLFQTKIQVIDSAPSDIFQRSTTYLFFRRKLH